MKLRILGDAIRLRLKRGEVDQIAAGTSIVEETHFPNAVLTFRLDVSENSEVSASFDNGNLVVSLPKSVALSLVITEIVKTITSVRPLWHDQGFFTYAFGRR